MCLHACPMTASFSDVCCNKECASNPWLGEVPLATATTMARQHPPAHESSEQVAKPLESTSPDVTATRQTLNPKKDQLKAGL
jgi:hypothetical protein